MGIKYGDPRVMDRFVNGRASYGRLCDFDTGVQEFPTTFFTLPVGESVEEVIFPAIIEVCTRTQQWDFLLDLLRRLKQVDCHAKLSSSTRGSMIKACGQAGNANRVQKPSAAVQDCDAAIGIKMAAVTARIHQKASEAEDPVLKAFEKFQQDFDKVYNEVEKVQRFTNFAKNFATIQEDNAKGNSFTLAIHEFSDLSAEEFAQAKLGYKGAKAWGNLPNLGMHQVTDEVLPDSVDWTQQGAVTAVKNQGVIDSEDLPSSISRETLQQNKILRVTEKNLGRRCLEMFAEIAERKDDYKQFCEQFEKCFRLGVHEDSTIRTKVAGLLRWHTLKSGDEQINIKEYVDRMTEGQNDFDSITGGIAAVSSSPFLEKEFQFR